MTFLERLGRKLKESNLYGSVGRTKQTNTGAGKIAYPTSEKAGKGDWTNESNIYADPTAANKPDGKLLKNFRGKGHA